MPARTVVPDNTARAVNRPARGGVREVQRLVVLGTVADQGDEGVGDAPAEGILEGEVLLGVRIQRRLVVERQQQHATVLREVPDRGLAAAVVPGRTARAGHRHRVDPGDAVRDGRSAPYFREGVHRL
ncbi:hypothetical protein [Streptomyces sp. NPDC001985]|uniref:hypothetical protein n=1 Tax=Streptomyces sp. NPDC001985 TaxID=3154406 RepID=UPI003323A86A